MAEDRQRWQQLNKNARMNRRAVRKFGSDTWWHIICFPRLSQVDALSVSPAILNKRLTISDQATYIEYGKN